MKPTDITYSDDGLFTRFMPLTLEGETAWRQIANNAPCAAIPINQKQQFIKALKAAGYTVRKKALKSEVITISDDDLLAELVL